MLYLHWNNDWDDGLPKREACLFLVAATQTTTHSVPHLIAHLRRVVRTPTPRTGPRCSTGSSSSGPPMKTLRLHLPSPALLRIANEDVTLSNGKIDCRR